jgi:hypothetical protein
MAAIGLLLNGIGMVTILLHVFPGVAILACATVYGADLFAAMVIRSALADVDDRTLTTMMGRIHYYAGRRMPIPFAASVVTSMLSLLTALMAGHTAAVVASAIAVLALLSWLTVYLRVNAPINRALTAAATNATTPPDARTQQRRWNSVIPLRLTLQGIAMAALCTALALV